MNPRLYTIKSSVTEDDYLYEIVESGGQTGVRCRIYVSAVELFKDCFDLFLIPEELKTKYEEAYKSIYKAYENIDYYDNEVLRADNKVTSTTVIYYGKVDMNKILEIEGEEDNVKVENGKIKLSDWKKFAKEYGTKCN